MGKYTSTEKLITHTGSFRKIIIHMDIAKKLLDKDLLNQLNNVLIELNDIQESRQNNCVKVGEK